MNVANTLVWTHGIRQGEVQGRSEVEEVGKVEVEEFGGQRFYFVKNLACLCCLS